MDDELTKLLEGTEDTNLSLYEQIRTIRFNTGHRKLITKLVDIVKPSTYLEIGVREGDSIEAVLKAKHVTQLIALCDTWGKESGGTGRGNHKHIHKLFEDYYYGGMKIWLDGPSAYILDFLRLHSFDIVHIDGDHKTNAALQDLLTARKLASKLIIIHDISFESVKKAMVRFERAHTVNEKQLIEFSGDQGTGIYILA